MTEVLSIPVESEDLQEFKATTGLSLTEFI